MHIYSDISMTIITITSGKDPISKGINNIHNLNNINYINNTPTTQTFKTER